MLCRYSSPELDLHRKLGRRLAVPAMLIGLDLVMQTVQQGFIFLAELPPDSLRKGRRHLHHCVVA